MIMLLYTSGHTDSKYMYVILVHLLRLVTNKSVSGLIDKDFWYSLTQNELTESLNKQYNLNTNVAKNIILVIGDGMGVTTTTGELLLPQVSYSHHS